MLFENICDLFGELLVLTRLLSLFEGSILVGFPFGVLTIVFVFAIALVGGAITFAVV